MALYGLYCADVPLRNCSITHSKKKKNYLSIKFELSSLLLFPCNLVLSDALRAFL